MLVVSAKSNLGCEAGCGVRLSFSDHARVILGSAPHSTWRFSCFRDVILRTIFRGRCSISWCDIHCATDGEWKCRACGMWRACGQRWVGAACCCVLHYGTVLGSWRPWVADQWWLLLGGAVWWMCWYINSVSLKQLCRRLWVVRSL